MASQVTQPNFYFPAPQLVGMSGNRNLHSNTKAGYDYQEERSNGNVPNNQNEGFQDSDNLGGGTWQDSEEDYDGQLVVTVNPLFPRPVLPTFPYTDPNELRKTCNLYGFVKSIPPDRLNNALYSKLIDIVEEGTNRVLLRCVPKRMLILFIGRPRISRFLQTAEWDKTNQQLLIPRDSANYVGLKIMVSWMVRACRVETMFAIQEMHLPENLFVAISLARTFYLFQLFRDANRVDSHIARHLFRRPLFPDSVREIWNLLPKDSRYTCRMVKQLADMMKGLEKGRRRRLPRQEELFEFLNRHPDLKLRIEQAKEHEDTVDGTIANQEGSQHYNGRKT